MIPGILLAVHISDGILATPWWLAGIGLTVLLALVGAWRIRDEEIPRIALLTAAFFVATLIPIPIPLGPTHAHLLFNGLMGVLLGWRAAMAIPLAVILQAVLGHGGFTTIGVNSCVMTVPAILAGYLFSLFRRLPCLNRPWFQMVLVGFSTLVWTLSLVYSITLLCHRDLVETSPVGALALANEITFHPITLTMAGLFLVLAVWVERKLGNAPEFPLGLLIGELAVLTTVALNCVVLLVGGESNWTVPALILVVVHLPIAVIEGIVMGFTVGLLARVRPDMLGIPSSISCQQSVVSSKNSRNGVAEPHADKISSLPSAICYPKSVLMAVLALFGLAGPVQAHRLEGDYKILPDKKVQIESWFDLTGASPPGAIVKVFKENDEILAEGALDSKGVFVFSFSRPEPLRVVISAGLGHRKELSIPLTALARSLTDSSSMPPEPSPADRSTRISIKDFLMGIGFVLALAAFFLSWRNARRLRELQATISPPETPPRAVPPTDPGPR